MNERIWGIIGGVALLLAFLSPLVLGNSKKVERFFEEAEALYERSSYENAIEKYKDALKESNKLGAKTEHIDKDFTSLVNLKIVQCYYYLAEETQDVKYYRDALGHIEKVSSKAYVAGHVEELTYLWANILYKTEKFDLAESKFDQLINDFPNSRWIPKALFIIGEINYQQESREEALSAFQRLVDEFSHSEFTAKAEQYINELLSSNGPEPGPPGPEPVPQDVGMYSDAINLKQQGKVHDAYELYTNLIARFPEGEHVTDAYVGKADIHLEAENYVKARENYEEAIYSTDDEERRVELYEAYHRTYLTPDPISPTPSPEPNDELFTKGMLLRMEKRFSEAAETFEELTNNSLSTEDISSGLYWSGRCYHDASRFKKSVDAYEKLIADYDDSSYTIKAYYYLALAYRDWAKVFRDQSKYELVINTVDEANTKYVNNSDSSVYGWLSRMQDLEEEARKKLTSPLPDPTEEKEHTDKNGEDPDPHIKRKNKNGQLTREANKHPEPTKREKPDKDKYYGRGLTFFDESQYEKAIEAFKNAINIDSEFKEAHFYLGVIYIKQKRHAEAIKAFEKAIRIDSEFKEAYYNLSLVHLESNDRKKAREAAKSALRIDPDYEPARLLIEFVTD